MTAPEHLPEDVAAVWAEITAAHPLPESIEGPSLEAYCTLVAALRVARARIAAEGLVVADARGNAVPHPAITVERDLAREIRAWGNRFASRGVARRRRGTVADATARSVAAAGHLTKVHDGPVAVLKTLAWLIDEAQRDGIEALQKAAFGTIPTYLKAAHELQLTPASVPVEKGKGGARVGKLAHLRSVSGPPGS